MVDYNRPVIQWTVMGADDAGMGGEVALSRRVLGPVQRIFEPVVGMQVSRAVPGEWGTWGGGAISAAVFSDFPRIVLQRGRRGQRGDVHAVLDQLQLSLLDRLIGIDYDVPVYVFCAELIETDVHALRRRLERYRGEVMVGRLLIDER